MGKSSTSIWTRIKNYPHLGLVVLAYVAFVALGMPDGLLGVAWPGIQVGGTLISADLDTDH
jgi:hypothetical protein